MVKEKVVTFKITKALLNNHGEELVNLVRSCLNGDVVDRGHVQKELERLVDGLATDYFNLGYLEQGK